MRLLVIGLIILLFSIILFVIFNLPLRSSDLNIGNIVGVVLLIVSILIIAYVGNKEIDEL